MTDDYPLLSFSTGLDVDGMDMAEWVSHAYHDLFRAKLALELWGWDEQATMAGNIGGELLELLKSMKEASEQEDFDDRLQRGGPRRRGARLEEHEGDRGLRAGRPEGQGARSISPPLEALEVGHGGA